jgi:XRE family transcriptional regulator, aerobic/anaerobic benzoate catabolism transcriptional regulator
MSTNKTALAEAAPPPLTTESVAMRTLAGKVRSQRAARKLTRRELAIASNVSERHLAQLERGSGNISICLLSRVAAALNTSIADLFGGGSSPNGAFLSTELDQIHSLLQPLPEHRLALIRHQLSKDLDHSGRRGKHCIALIGLRGAGKSTLGTRLGQAYQVPFIELDHEVERESSTGLAEIFLLHGQAGYLQLERRVLQRVLDEHPYSIIATGGSIVTDPATYDVLLKSCFTVWVKATPEEHMARVVAQGDLRPMRGNAQAMKDLRRILELREPLYRQADLVIDTRGHSVEQSFQQLRNLLAQQTKG